MEDLYLLENQDLVHVVDDTWGPEGVEPYLADEVVVASSSEVVFVVVPMTAEGIPKKLSHKGTLEQYLAEADPKGEMRAEVAM